MTSTLMTSGAVVSPLITPADSDRGARTVDEFCRWASISRSKFYEIVAAGELRIVKCGSRTLVRHEDGVAWLNSLPSGPEATAPAPRRKRA